MAENADIELTVGAIADIASLNKVGQQIRDHLQKYVSESLTAVGRGSATVASYLAGARAANSGVDIYSSIRAARNEVARIKADAARDSRILGINNSTEAQILDSVLDTLNVATNVSKRTSVYAPINSTLSGRRSATARASREAFLRSEALRTGGLSAAIYRNVFSKGMTAEERVRAREDALAAWTPIEEDPRGRTMDSQRVMSAIYKNVYGRGFTADERARAREDAMAAWSPIDENPQRVMAAIYKNVYSKGMTPDERARAREDAMAVWATKDNTKALKQLTVVTSGVVATGLRTLAEVIPTYWHENVTRSTMGRLEAGVARAQAVGKGGGSIVGTILGGVVGGAVGGVAGAAVGAGVGSQIGGAVGGLWGDYKKERLESTKRSISQIQQLYKAYGIYGGQYSVGYANTVAETGMASAEDVNKMTHNSATLAARMMFGQVGENEMLMYSLMPGYFAAAMSGASDAQLAEAYAADVQRLPNQLRVWAAENVGGGSLGMLAYTNSPVFGDVQHFAGEARMLDAAQMRMGSGFMVQSAYRGMIDRRAELNALSVDTTYAMRHPREGIWLPSDYAAESALLRFGGGREVPASLAQSYYESMGRMLTSGEAPESLYGRDAVHQTAQRVLQQVINVNIDGETIRSEENEITDEMMRGGYTPTLTSLVGVD